MNGKQDLSYVQQAPGATGAYAQQQQQQQYQPPAPPSYEAPLPMVLKVYKAGGMFSKDDVVVPAGGPGAAGPCYYLEFPWSWTSSWNLTLHSGPHKEGPTIATLTKGGYGFSRNDIEIRLLNGGFTTVLAKRSLFSRSHEFDGLYGGTFKWKTGMMTSGMTCIDQSNGVEVARWERSYMSFTKDGKLGVNPTYNSMLDLIVATALAMEEWMREQRERRSN